VNRALVTALCVFLLSACQVNNSSSPVRTPTGEPRPVVFPDPLVYASGTRIHAGGLAYDLNFEYIQKMAWTPYGLYLTLGPRPLGGFNREVFFDGHPHELDAKVMGQVVTSSDGSLVAYVDERGPMTIPGRLAELVVLDAATGEEIFATHEGMGGDHGDDLQARYTAHPPEALAITSEYVEWRNAMGTGERIRTDLTTGESTVISEPPPVPVASYSQSRDGKRVVALPQGGQVFVEGRSFNFKKRFQQFGGWLNNTTFLVIERDRWPYQKEPRNPDTSKGVLKKCFFRNNRCRKVADVIGANVMVFPGWPNRYLSPP
jgi:hypothetical protein